MTIEVYHENDLLTIEDMEGGEDITVTELTGGQFEIEVNIEVGEHFAKRTFTLSRKQMIELKNWIVERLR